MHEDLKLAILELIKKIESANRELEFEYFLSEGAFYVNILGKKNIGRISVFENGSADFEAIDDDANTLIYKHLEDAGDTRSFVAYANSVVLIASLSETSP